MNSICSKKKADFDFFLISFLFVSYVKKMFSQNEKLCNIKIKICIVLYALSQLRKQIKQI